MGKYAEHIFVKAIDDDCGRHVSCLLSHILSSSVSLTFQQRMLNSKHIRYIPAVLHTCLLRRARLLLQFAHSANFCVTRPPNLVETLYKYSHALTLLHFTD